MRQLALCVAVVCAAAFGLSHAQEEPPRHKVTVRVDLAYIAVKALDSAAKPLRNLGPADFRVLEDGIERPIVAVEFQPGITKEKALAIALLIDVSGSMDDFDFDVGKEAVANLLHSLPEDVPVSLFRFDDKVRILAPLGRDRNQILEKFPEHAGNGGTECGNALVGVSSYLARNAPDAEKVVIMLSDFGCRSRDDELAAVRAADIRLIGWYTRGSLPEGAVAGMAQKSGGSYALDRAPYEALRFLEKLHASRPDDWYYVAFIPLEGREGAGQLEVQLTWGAQGKDYVLILKKPRF